MVLGSGPGGQKAAIAAAKLGRRVAVVERRNMIGGVSVNTGTIPSKTLREAVLFLTGHHQRELYGQSYRVKEEITVADLMARTRHVIGREVDVIRSQLLRNRIMLLQGTGRFLDPHTIGVVDEYGRETKVSAEKIIIATGTRPARPESVEFDGRTIIDSDDILALERVPDTLVVVGAGVIGIEYASMFAALGTKVTVIERRERMLEFVDLEIVESLKYHLRDLAVTFRFGEHVTAVERHPDGAIIVLESGKRIPADTVLYSAGRQGMTDGIGLENAGLTADARGRIAVDELRGPDGLRSDGEMRDVVGLLAELPDLWDVNVSDWSNDSQTARFAGEGYQEPYIGFVKAMTSKPVVGVGRYTSPDRMVSLVQKGVLDFIGAARPSIADPFLPKKIEEGRIEDIRECIGCNICVSGDMTISPIRCTQNPTMAEEWRKGWHPERIAPAASDDPVLVVGAGPAGLECARALGQRGYPVVLAEATEMLGGRSKREALLPGLASYGRVADWRIGQLRVMPNVEIYRASALTPDDVLGFGFPHIVIATGAEWRRDGIGRTLRTGVPIEAGVPLFTPDDVMDGRLPEGGRALVYDDDHYYMGGVVAERLAAAGLRVTLMTTDPVVSSWTVHTLEQRWIQRGLLERGIALLTNRVPVRLGRTTEHACVYTGARAELETDALVLVTSRIPRDGLYQALRAMPDAPWKTLHVIGDAAAPGTIAAAVYAGHNRARLHDAPPHDGVPFERE